MIIVGLTGQSGAGKTTVSGVFESKGFHVINADYISREISKKPEVLLELQGSFGENIVIDGVLDRRSLGKLVFSSRELLDILSSIMFPKVKEEIEKQIKNSTSQYILLDAPQLFEGGADNLCAKIVAVIAPKDILIQRIMKRDGISERDAIQRLNSQKSETFFLENADFAIQNDGDVLSLIDKTEEVIEKII